MERIVQVANVFFLINAVLAIYRWNRVDGRHRPFLAYLVVSMVFAFQQHFIARYINFSADLFILCEGLLLLWSLYAWRYLDRHRGLFLPLLVLFGIVWLAEIIIRWEAEAPILYYYRVVYSFVLVLVAINGMNIDIVHYKGNLLRHSSFLVAGAIVLYFTYNVLLESFYIAGIEGYFAGIEKPSYNIKNVFKLVSLIIFTLAVLWMPPKK
jgi:hypothetical protein